MDTALKTLIDNQISYFSSKKTFDINFRIQKLNNLLKEIKNSEKEIEIALFKDLGKSKGESYLTEIHFIYTEINIALKNIRKWTKRKTVKSSLVILRLGRILYNLFILSSSLSCGRFTNVAFVLYPDSFAPVFSDDFLFVNGEI